MLTTKRVARVESKKRKLKAFLQLANTMNDNLLSCADDVSFVKTVCLRCNWQQRMQSTYIRSINSSGRSAILLLALENC